MQFDKSYFLELGIRINFPDYIEAPSAQNAPKKITLKSLDDFNKQAIQEILHHESMLILCLPENLFKTPEELANWQAGFLGPLCPDRYDPDRLFTKIKAKKNKTFQYANTHLSQPTHTDDGYTKEHPRIISMYCKIPAEEGGLSIIVLLENLLQALEGKFGSQVEQLFDPKAIFVNSVIGSEYKSILLHLPDGRVGISYSAMVHQIECTPEIYAMFEFITEYLHEPANQIRYKLAKHELLILDNCRALHARTAFPLDDPREIYRFWFSQ